MLKTNMELIPRKRWPLNSELVRAVTVQWLWGISACKAVWLAEEEAPAWRLLNPFAIEIIT
jgi:hypothetical protein